ncbi:unnamed protein product [Protopolystoma xenopodis]|uniref:Uncharacterized protein n=1 Tax=Protopolystoma xenopodis TaxID=117903 RepID=A0A448X679_9PLAT|nr:unnamed protein product [Protopolystoma xenopodis]
MSEAGYAVFWLPCCRAIAVNQITRPCLLRKPRESTLLPVEIRVLRTQSPCTTPERGEKF